MTEKELLYLEDVLNHINDLKEITSYYTEDVKEELANLLQNIANVSEQEYKKIYNLM